jgi:integrase
MPKKPKCWCFSTGYKGSTVTVYERKPGGLLYARAFDNTLADGRGGYRRVSLGHRDRERAKTYAMQQTAKLREGHSEMLESKVALGRVIGVYLANRTPRKTPAEQDADRRKGAMWSRVLGSQKDPHRITMGEWERFIVARGCGAIDAHGEAVVSEAQRAVRPRTVQQDCQWLRLLLNWAIKWRGEDGRYLLRENAVRGFDLPGEENPRRPVASTDRYEAIRAVSDKVLTEVRWAGSKRERSYLSELLDLAQGTGRRISAICALRFEDLRLDVKPYGAIRWPAATDKQGRETTAPISPLVRSAIDRVLRERPGIGARYLFPSPANPDEPVAYERVRRWLLEAERIAGLPKQQGSLWHAYRRGWATARKQHSLTDTAAAGGWASTETLSRCYQQPDDQAMLAVVLGGVALRERSAL